MSNENSAREYGNLLEQISDELVETQETLEVLEEAGEATLVELKATRDWAKTMGDNLLHFQADVEGCQAMLERIDSSLADLAVIQEDIATALGTEPE